MGIKLQDVYKNIKVMKINTYKSCPKGFDSLMVLIADLKDLKQALAKTGIAVKLSLLKDHLKENGDFITTLDEKRGKVMFVRLNSQKCPAEHSKTIRQLIIKNRNLFGSKLNILLPEGSEAEEKWIRIATQACMLSSNNIGMYKYKQNNLPRIEEVAITACSDNVPNQALVDEEIIIANCQLEMMELINTPSNIKTPKYIAEYAQKLGNSYGFKVDVQTEKEIKKHQLSALLSVNDGSGHPPRFVVCHYKPKNAVKVKTLGLVGKGVTFDTGGISIKSSTNMHFMKSDMSGGALVLAFTTLCARLNLPIEVITTIPLTENMVDGKSTKPGDVIGSYIGKTIEVIDTDAEGRLILADGLGYLTKNYKTDVLINFATLTGSVIQTLGYQVAGLFSNNDTLASNLYDAGQKSNEKCWRLPIWDHYADDLKSDIADVKNYSGKPVAGAITAALFLKEFILDHPNWAHVDIAGVSFTDNEYGSMRNATGYGVNLLLEYVRQFLID